MKTIIRKGVKEDLPSVLQLIKELARYENAEHEVTITLEDLENDGFAESLFLAGSVIASETKQFISPYVAGLNFQFRFDSRSLM